MSMIKRVWPGEMTLGEAPAWDSSTGHLWFVDIKQQRVHRLDPGSDAVRSWDAPAPIGWVLPAGKNGSLLAGMKTGLAQFDPASGRFDLVAEVEPHVPGNRLNDATVAADGSVWFGSMDDAETADTGRIYRWDGTAVTAADLAPVCITNGPCFSPDGATLYHVDTLGGIIHASQVGLQGAVEHTRIFARIDPADGYPDGIVADVAGNIWVGLWNGWCARQYAPDGSIRTQVRLPAANITKVALGGPDLRTAYVTSARKGLDAQALAEQPDAGSLFSFEVDVPGQPLPMARIS